MSQGKKPWWRTDPYFGEAPVPEGIEELAGPHGVALVRVWPDGRTDVGWGLQGPKHEPDVGFMPRYMRGDFNARRVIYGYNRSKWAFAFIMRSLRVVAIDIDGKNGGLEHAKKLGMLPYTLAETSKSGDGFHLFYTVDEEWDDETGYGLLADRIGIEQGVDIRATGCVYHHNTQRWNGRTIAPLPDHLRTLLLHREQKQAETTRRIEKVLDSHDDLEILMMQAELEQELAKPVPQGKRNNTLFAIGTKMKQAQVQGWEEKVSDRATQLGLGTDEADKLVDNITRYGS